MHRGPKPARPLRGFLLVMASNVALSTTAIFIKALLVNYQMEPMALALWRVALVAAALGAGLAFQPHLFQVRRRDLGILALYGILGVGLHQVTWITSVQFNGAGIATVLVYVQPAIVALLSWLFLSESFGRRKLAALALSLTGVFLVSGALQSGTTALQPLGILAGLGTALTWSSFALLGRVVTRRYSPWTAVFYAFAFGVLALLPAQLWVTDWLVPGGALDGWALVFALALGPTLTGFALYTMGLEHLPASVTVLLGTAEPVFSIILAYLFFGERMALLQLLGTGLILWGVILLRPQRRDAEPRLAQTA